MVQKKRKLPLLRCKLSKSGLRANSPAARLKVELEKGRRMRGVVVGSREMRDTVRNDML